MINLVKKKNDLKHLRIANKTDLEKYEIAVEAIEKSMVLLKNDGVLPLNATSILTIGQMAEFPAIGGGGSSFVEPIIPIKSLKEELQELIPDSKIDYCNGYYMNGSKVCAFGTRVCMEKAQNNDVSIIVIGNNQHIELESVDRTDISLNKEFVDLAFLDVVFLQRVIYIMQLKRIGVDDINIKKCINDLFQCNLLIE